MMEKDTKVTAPDEIWANVAAWSFGQALAGEWNYQDVGSPDDTRYIRKALYDEAKAEIECLREAMQVMASRADDEIEQLRAALRGLDKAASEVARYGAQPGPQWGKLTIASLIARALINKEAKE